MVESGAWVGARGDGVANAGPRPRSTEVSWSSPEPGSEREATGALDAGDGRLMEGAALRALTAPWTGARKLWRTVCRRAHSEWRVSEVRRWRLGDDFSGSFDAGAAAIDDGSGNWRTVTE